MKRSAPIMRKTQMQRTGILRTASTQMAAKADKACEVCGKPFTARSSFQRVCNGACAVKLGRRELAARKESVKTRSDWIKDAQVAFNAYIRFRDRNHTCICCGKPFGTGTVGGTFDCGHYRSVGSAPHLRFDERNAHGQTKQCNRYGAGRAVDYRIGLIARIGLASVEALEADNVPKHWSIEDLKAIRDLYRAKLKELKQ